MTIEWVDHLPGQQIHTMEPEPDGTVVTLLGNIGVGDYVRIPKQLHEKYQPGSQQRITATHRADCIQCSQDAKLYILENGIRVIECHTCAFLWLPFDAACPKCHNSGIHEVDGIEEIFRCPACNGNPK